MSVKNTTLPCWSRDAGDLTASLGSGPNGLSATQAAERLAAAGPNSVEDARRLGPLRLLLRQVESPLVLHPDLRGCDIVLTDAITADLSTYYEAKGKAGFPVLALATRIISAKGAITATTRRK